VAAVIKIQKIWRGYQTRKILDKVITDMIKDYKPSAESPSSLGADPILNKTKAFHLIPLQLVVIILMNN
jgi:hypothetical protein